MHHRVPVKVFPRALRNLSANLYARDTDITIVKSHFTHPDIFGHYSVLDIDRCRLSTQKDIVLHFHRDWDDKNWRLENAIYLYSLKPHLSLINFSL